MSEERGTVLQPTKQEVSGLLPLLGKREVWDEFLSYKKEKQHLSRKDARYWTKFVEEEQYRSVTDRIPEPDFSLSVPVKLSVNKSNTGKKRVVYSFPEKHHGEAFEFLGFSIQGTDGPEKGMPAGKVDLSEAALRKMKTKIRRKAHLLYRRQKNNGKNPPLTFEESARILLKTFNRKYFDEAEEDRFTWSRWFFPVLTCTDGLGKLDAYLLSYVRFLKTGRHYKGNYRVRYEEIKALGYRSLVHEYYEWKNSSR